VAWQKQNLFLLFGQKTLTVLFSRQLTILFLPVGLAEAKSVYWQGRKHSLCLLPDSNTNWPGKKHFPFLLAWQKS
jgi:hypothetical protein